MIRGGRYKQADSLGTSQPAVSHLSRALDDPRATEPITQEEVIHEPSGQDADLC